MLFKFFSLSLLALAVAQDTSVQQVERALKASRVIPDVLPATFTPRFPIEVSLREGVTDRSELISTAQGYFHWSRYEGGYTNHRRRASEDKSSAHYTGHGDKAYHEQRLWTFLRLPSGRMIERLPENHSWSLLYIRSEIHLTARADSLNRSILTHQVLQTGMSLRSFTSWASTSLARGSLMVSSIWRTSRSLSWTSYIPNLLRDRFLIGEKPMEDVIHVLIIIRYVVATYLQASSKVDVMNGTVPANRQNFNLTTFVDGTQGELTLLGATFFMVGPDATST